MMIQSPTYIPLFNRLNRIYGIYRIILGVLLSVLFIGTKQNLLFGYSAPELFLITTAVYSVCAVIQLITLDVTSYESNWHAILMLISDVLLLTVLSYANGGPSLQLSLLYLVVVMAASILLPPKQALMIALMAVISVIYQQFYYSLAENMTFRSLGAAVFLSTIFMGASLLGQVATRRLNQAEKLVQEQSDEVQLYQQLSALVLEEIPNALIVLDNDLKIMMHNQAAQHLLEQTVPFRHAALAQIAPDLAEGVKRIMQEKKNHFHWVPRIASPFPEGIYVNMVPLIFDQQRDCTLLVLEQVSKIHYQAQQMKLASLGKLTAGIAHEIRNPLAAIAQASELMADSLQDEENSKLLKMVIRQSSRINQIIEDVLNISRKSASIQQTLMLGDWLSRHIQEIKMTQDVDIELHQEQKVDVLFDPLQLEQIMDNLISNAIYHSSKMGHRPWIKLTIGQMSNGHKFLEVQDNGSGILQEHQDILFDPFFTTESQGTGLGLYLCRIMCDANQASIAYVARAQGACFRIVFSRRLKPR